MKKYFSLFILAVFLPVQVFAAAERTLQNPLSGEGSLTLSQLVLRFNTWFTSILAIASLIFVIIGGLEMALSGGSEDKIASGKKTVFYAVIGLIIAFAGYLVIPIILQPFTPNS